MRRARYTSTRDALLGIVVVEPKWLRSTGLFRSVPGCAGTSTNGHFTRRPTQHPCQTQTHMQSRMPRFDFRLQSLMPCLQSLMLCLLPRRVIRSLLTTGLTTGLGKARGSLDDRHNASTNASSSELRRCTVHRAGPCSARASTACHPCRSS